MDKESVLNILSEFRRALERRGVRGARLILFGSHVNGAATEDSDIDVVVISKDLEGESHWERIGLLADAIYDVFKPIEAIPFTPEEWERGHSVFVEFAKKGEVVTG